MKHDPIAKFIAWLDEAGQDATITEPSAMTVATCDHKGNPSARIILLRGVDNRGFAFYTNMESRKSRDIKNNPKAALCFYWMPLNRQVRVEGHIEPVSDAEADAYFISRPREHQISAWASKQSQPMENPKMLEKSFEEQTARFAGQDVPRPPYWSGWRVIPDTIEFWQQGDFRLHDRERFTRDGKGWTVERLFP